MGQFGHGGRRRVGTGLSALAAGLLGAAAIGLGAHPAPAHADPGAAPPITETTPGLRPRSGPVRPDTGRISSAPAVTTTATNPGGLPGGTGGSGLGQSTTTTAAAPPPPTPVQVQVSTSAVSDPLPAGFLGFSVEFGAIHAYLGRDPADLNPVFAQLVAALAQGQPPILRIGGNSSDQTWLPLPGLIPPYGVNYAISPDWLATVATFAQATDTRLILGVNLGADDPQMTAVESRAFVNAIGRQHIQSLEIGNEPDLYTRSAWYYPPKGAPVYRRVPPYSANAYLREFRDWQTTLPSLPVVAGTLAALNWLPNVTALAATDPNVSTATIHRYPLTNCGARPDAPYYPTQANLFSPASTSGVATPLKPYATTLHQAGVELRVDELNSASCEGSPGLSNSFASALWVVDALFNLAAAGVDGINLHTLPGAAYAPFAFSQSGGVWNGEVRPVYYGMLLFARAFPPGAALLGTSDSSSDNGGDVKAFATLAPNGTVRTVLINEDPSAAASVTLTLPVTGTLSAQSLTAPALNATSGVALGGRSFPSPTHSGVLAAPALSDVASNNGTYSLTVPAGSAVLLSSGH